MLEFFQKVFATECFFSLTGNFLLFRSFIINVTVEGPVDLL